MLTKFSIAAVACALMAGAFTVPAEAGVNQRQNRQQNRIANGISKGSVTPREAIRLEKQQARISRYEARSRADGGGIDRREAKRLDTMQDRASRTIRHQKHDRQRRR
jgi:hypothetical protein